MGHGITDKVQRCAENERRVRLAALMCNCAAGIAAAKVESV
jgi:hypothetical protein